MKINSIQNKSNFGMAKLVGGTRILAIIASHEVNNIQEKILLKKSLLKISDNYVDHFLHTYQVGDKYYFKLTDIRNEWLALLKKPSIKYKANANKSLPQIFTELGNLIEKSASQNKLQKELDIIDKLQRR